MSHRKILSVTLKVVVDVDNDEFDESKISAAYGDSMIKALDEFAENTTATLTGTDIVSVNTVELVDWDVTL